MKAVFILIFWWPGTESSGLSPAYPFATVEECRQAAADIKVTSWARMEYACVKSSVVPQ